MNLQTCRSKVQSSIRRSREAVSSENPSNIVDCLTELEQLLERIEELSGMKLSDVMEMLQTVERRHSATVMPFEENIIRTIIESMEGIRGDHLDLMRDMLTAFLDTLAQVIEHFSPLGFSEFWAAHAFKSESMSHERAVHGAVMHLLLQQHAHVSNKLDKADFNALQAFVDRQLEREVSSMNSEVVTSCLAAVGAEYNFHPAVTHAKNTAEAVRFIMAQVKGGSPPMVQLMSRIGNLHYATILKAEIERDVGIITTADELQIPLKMFRGMLKRAPSPNTIWSIQPRADDPPTIDELKLPPKS